MTTQKELEFLKWCKVQGIDTVASDNIRTYSQNNQNCHPCESRDPDFYKTTLGKELDSRFRGNDKIDETNPALLARQIANNCTTLQDLKAAVQNFDGCLLKKTASNTVFSDGSPSANVMLIGEAPGANEDLKGIPFCGESGKLLDKVLKSIGLVRDSSIYITNSIFWRPPGNRKPTDEEIKCCLPFVEKHIALIKPKLIILAGSVALQTLFGNTGSISKQRQRILSYKNEYLDAPIAATAIFHPSYLLRQPSQKKLAWYDMLFIRNFLMNHG